MDEGAREISLKFHAPHTHLVADPESALIADPAEWWNANLVLAGDTRISVPLYLWGRTSYRVPGVNLHEVL
jgi:hypothetical protein